MSKNSEGLLAKLKQTAEEAQALQKLWDSLMPKDERFSPPELRQWQTWLNSFSFDEVVYGVDTASRRYYKNLQDMEVAAAEGKEHTDAMSQQAKWPP